MKRFWYWFWMFVFCLVPAAVVGLGAGILFWERELGYLFGLCMFGFSVHVLHGASGELRENL